MSEIQITKIRPADEAAQFTDDWPGPAKDIPGITSPKKASPSAPPQGEAAEAFDEDYHKSVDGKPVFRADGKTLCVKPGNPMMKIKGWLKKGRFDLIKREYPERFDRLREKGKIPADALKEKAPEPPPPPPGTSPNPEPPPQAVRDNVEPFPTMDSGPEIASPEAEASTAAQVVPSMDQIVQAAKSTVAQTEIAGISLAGMAGVIDKQTKQALEAAYVAYYRQNGIWEPPAWLGLVGANAVYLRAVVEKVDHEKPTTLIGGIKGRIVTKYKLWAAGRQVRQSQEQVEGLN